MAVSLEGERGTEFLLFGGAWRLWCPALLQAALGVRRTQKARYYQRSHFFSTPVTVLRFRNNQPA